MSTMILRMKCKLEAQGLAVGICEFMEKNPRLKLHLDLLFLNVRVENKMKTASKKCFFEHKKKMKIVTEVRG